MRMGIATKQIGCAAWTFAIAIHAIACPGWLATPACAQTLPPPRTTPITGFDATPARSTPAGLPGGNPSLQQPVYVSDRSDAVGAKLSRTVESIAVPRVAEPDWEEAPIGLFDEQRALESPPIPVGEYFEAATVIAVVGDERILLGDLIDPKKVTPQMVASRDFELALRKTLVKSIETKCLAQHFFTLQSSGKPKKEREEIRMKISSKTAEMFKTRVLPDQIKHAKCESELEFIELLEKNGQSLPAMLRSWSEQMWADQALREGVKEKQTVELHEMQDWYDSHSDDWNKPARVRFQIMSAMFKKYPSRDAAYADIADMGNQVFLGGASFDAIARLKSSGFNAKEGGHFDWTQRGSLKSKVIEEAAFSIEVQALSTILEDEDGLHIIKVLEREPDYRMTFQQAQAEIRKAVAKAKKDQEKQDYIKKVREMTPIWTKWPEDIPGSRKLDEIL